MTDNERSSMDWVFAVLASVVLHAGVVGLFVMSGRPAAPADETSEPVTAATPSAGATGGGEEAEPGAETPGDESGEAPDDAAARQTAASASSAAPAPAVSARRQEGRGDGSAQVAEMPEFYVVKQGDTLTKIARGFGTTPEDIAKANGKPVRQMDKIWVGQKIRLRK